jgi:hypothetical protein
MRDRLLTLVLAAASLLAFYILFVPRSQPEERITRPTSEELGPNGYAALVRWLEGQGVKTASFRERFGRLADAPGVPQKTGNLLVSTVPHYYPMRDSEREPLHSWISAGNTLLLVAGLSDTPDWSMNRGADPEFMMHMQSMTGLWFRMVRDERGRKVPGPRLMSVPPGTGTAADEEAQLEKELEAADDAEAADAPEAGDAPGADEDPNAEDDQAADTQDGEEDDGSDAFEDAFAAVRQLAEPKRYEMTPTASHPLLAGVGSVHTLSDYPTVKWDAIGYSNPLLALAREKDIDTPMLWLMPFGDGQIIVCAYGNVFTNKVIGSADNARFLANVVAASVRGEGRVILDDAHQGRVAFYDPEAFFGDSRLHRSLWWLLGLWLVFVLGSQRLRSATSRWSPVDITTFVRATGGFMARVLKPASAGLRLIENFFDDVRRRAGLTEGDEPVWDWLRAHAGEHVAALRKIHDDAMRGRRIDLPRLQNLLVQLRACLK